MKGYSVSRNKLHSFIECVYFDSRNYFSVASEVARLRMLRPFKSGWTHRITFGSGNTCSIQNRIPLNHKTILALEPPILFLLVDSGSVSVSKRNRGSKVPEQEIFVGLKKVSGSEIRILYSQMHCITFLAASQGTQPQRSQARFVRWSSYELQ